MSDRDPSEARVVKTFCRFCHANCAIEVVVEGSIAREIRGDAEDPVFGGYTCLKGRELAAAHHHPARVREALRRRPDGGFEPVPVAVALDEIADRLSLIRARDGARAIASYNGTYAFQNSAALAVARAFHAAIGSPSFYTAVTLDQPAKSFTWSRFGAWGGGLHAFRDADVAMMIGNNPLVSHYAPAGSVPPFSPSRRLRDAKARGLKLIVIDPRLTETARLADIHLQVRPGEDAALLAGMIRVILNEERHDKAFCEAHVAGLDRLRTAVAGFTPEHVAHRAGVPAADVIAAARLFAQGPRGAATTGTGPEMAGRGTLTHHLVMTLNAICGRHYRAGEVSPVPQVLMPGPPRRAEVIPPTPLWGPGQEPSRLRGLTGLGGEMPTTTLAEEILTPGEGRIRALISVGGNPMLAWPDQDATARALDDLELLVAIDNRLSATARRAHYVIAPAMCLEREDMTLLSEWWYEEPYSRYAERILEPPPGTLNEWEFFYEVARRMGVTIQLPGGPLDPGHRPETFEVLDKIAAGAKVPLSRIRAETAHRIGATFPEARHIVEPGRPDNPARLQAGLEAAMAELEALRAEALDDQGLPVGERAQRFTHRLISRRTRHRFNSTGADFERLSEGGGANPAHFHPDDLIALGLSPGDMVRIESAAGHVLALVEAEPGLRRGAISMAHGFGGGARDAEGVRREGASTNRLVRPDRDFDPITGMARQSAIPVRVVRAPPA